MEIEGICFAAEATNISLGGIFVESDFLIEYGESGRIRICVSGIDEFELEVTARWVEPGGVGLQFGSLRAIEVWALNRLLRALSEPTNARVEPPSMPPPRAAPPRLSRRTSSTSIVPPPM